MFIPLSLLCGRQWKWRGIVAGINISIVIGLVQPISLTGLFEFDDILHNTLGTFIGASVYILVRTVVEKTGNKNGLHK